VKNVTCKRAESVLMVVTIIDIHWFTSLAAFPDRPIQRATKM